jgi:hypothetical protein
MNADAGVTWRYLPPYRPDLRAVKIESELEIMKKEAVIVQARSKLASPCYSFLFFPEFDLKHTSIHSI